MGIDYEALDGQTVRILVKVRKIHYGASENRKQLCVRLRDYDQRTPNADPAVDHVAIDMCEHNTERLRHICGKYNLHYTYDYSKVMLIEVIVKFVLDQRELYNGKNELALSQLKNSAIERPLDKYFLMNFEHKEVKVETPDRERKDSAPKIDILHNNKDMTQEDKNILAKLERSPLPALQALCRKNKIEHYSSTSRENLIIKIIDHLRNLRLKQMQRAPSEIDRKRTESMSSPPTERLADLKLETAAKSRSSTSLAPATKAKFESNSSRKNSQSDTTLSKVTVQPEALGIDAELYKLLDTFNMEQLKQRAYSSGIAFHSNINKPQLIKEIMAADLRKAKAQALK